jgi:hypothetical protein
MPWGGATFTDVRIGEEGRQLLLGLLEQLSDEQLVGLFVSTRVTRFDQVASDGRDPHAWVAAFRAKVNEIRQAGPCDVAQRPMP